MFMQFLPAFLDSSFVLYVVHALWLFLQEFIFPNQLLPTKQVYGFDV